MNFSLLFDKDIRVEYKLFEHSLAHEWFSLLSERASRNDFYIESAFSGFGLSNEVSEITNKLFNTIKYIEQQKPETLPIKKVNTEWPIPTQKLLNELHFVYERIAKDENYRSKADLQKEVNNLNIYIHALENARAREKVKTTDSRVRCRFLKKGRNPFQFEKRKIIDKYNNLFNPIPVPGGIKLNYSQVGKDFMECYRRQDTLTVPKPLEEFSASFVAEFGPYDIEWHKNRLHLIRKWYNDLGYNIDDPANRLGYAYVAEMVNKSNLNTLINQISKNRQLISIVID